MSAGLNLEVWFAQPNEVSVFLESSYSDADEERFYETCLFALYAARQVANLRGDASLAYVLASTDTSNPLPQTLERLDEVRVVAPQTAGGRKGFTCELRPEKRAFFKLHQHGFGMLGKGAGYYAPTSTLALLYWLLDRRKDDPLYQRALAAAAENVGILGSRGAITVTSQASLAMEAATAAWAEAREALGIVEESEDDEENAGDEEDAEVFDQGDLSAEVERACEEYGIDFGELVGTAAAHLHEAMEAEPPEEGHIRIVSDEDARRTCRIEVLMAAGRAGNLEDGFEPIQTSFNALQAAEATGNEKMIEAAKAHYEATLARIAEDTGLEPVVEALEEELFTSDLEEAL